MEDNFEDFDFEGFMDQSNTDWDAKMEKWKARMVIHAIEMNFENISKNGIADWDSNHLNTEDMLQLQETIEYMIDHYEVEEEYEKCAVLKTELDKIKLYLEDVQ